MAESMDTTTMDAADQNGLVAKQQEEDVTMSEPVSEEVDKKHIKSESTEAAATKTEVSPDSDAISPTDAQEQKTDDQPLSKNALKRLKRQQAWEEKKKDRKLKDKLKKKAKKEAQAKERRAALGAKAETEKETAASENENEDKQGGGDDDHGNGASGVSHKRKAREDREGLEMTKKQKTKATVLPIGVIIDCGFDDLMHEKEVVSLSSQITRSYSDNRNAPLQVHLSITSLNKRLKHRMETTLRNYHRNWKRVKFSENDYEVTPENKDTLIYLSSDSDYTLEELEEGKTYIVGGIVDRNRHKGICHTKATEQGIKTAKLPIGDYIRMASRVVLTTNQVVDIMLKWLEYRDWQEAFLKVIPPRKGPEARKADDDDNEDDDNDDDDEGHEVDEEQEDNEKEEVVVTENENQKDENWLFR